MVNCQLPHALRQSLTVCSVPCTPDVTFRPLWFLPKNVVRCLAESRPPRRHIHSFPFGQARREQLSQRLHAHNLAGHRRPKSFGSQNGHLLHLGGADLLRLNGIAGPIQLVYDAQSCDATNGGGTMKALENESAECVEEDAGRQNDRTDDDKIAKQSDSISDDDVTILAQYMTRHNFVRVLEVSQNANSVLAGARVLLLDKPGNIHSIYHKYRLLTESYYDYLAALPAVIPEGPIGILGLGAGTAARLIHHFWPDIDIHGWEVDPGVVQAARKYFDMEELEWKGGRVMKEGGARPGMRQRNSSGSYGAWKDESDDVRMNIFQGMEMAPRDGHGKLRVHIGNALSSLAVVEGGFAGLIVDLFAEGAVIPALREVGTWQDLRAKLRPGGRIMVNCGGSCVEAAGAEKKDGGITMRETIAALAQVFPGELSITSLSDHDNSIALTGPSPDLQVWLATLPECLRRGIDFWRAF